MNPDNEIEEFAMALIEEMIPSDPHTGELHYDGLTIPVRALGIDIGRDGSIVVTYHAPTIAQFVHTMDVTI